MAQRQSRRRNKLRVSGSVKMRGRQFIFGGAVIGTSISLSGNVGGVKKNNGQKQKNHCDTNGFPRTILPPARVSPICLTLRSGCTISQR